MKFELTILGSSGAVPFRNRYMTAHLLEAREQLFLVDCGEGTQMRMSQYHVRRGKINHIFISHLHGDHLFGLPGLLTSFGLNQRDAPLHIFSPPGLKAMMDGLFPYGQKGAGYALIYHELDTTRHQLIHEDAQLEVHSIPLSHGVPCTGYLFREKPAPRKMRKDKMEELQIPFGDIPGIKAGKDWVAPDGGLIPNVELTTDPAPPRSYAFCSDTRYDESIIPYIKGVDLLYHEASFLHRDLDKAEATHHSTALQAATIARKAGVGRLVIGHYSARYEELAEHLEEASSVFPESYLAVDGGIYEVF